MSFFVYKKWVATLCPSPTHFQYILFCSYYLRLEEELLLLDELLLLLLGELLGE